MLKKIARKILPQGVLNLYYYYFAFLGAFLFGFPTRNLKVIGITGTKGKSSRARNILRRL